MRIIDIKIRNRIACVPDKEAYILCGNNDYVARFDLDEEWDNYTSKIAVFVSDGEMMTNVFTGNECEIPVMRNTSLCSIGITAGDIRTTTPAYVPCLACITDGDGEIVEPTPDVYAQIMEMLDEALDRIGAVAQGKTFQDVNDMLSSLNLAKADEYIVGQNIFTIDENAPDFWITATYPDYVEFKGSQADFLLQLSQNKVVRVGYYGISLLKTQSDDYVTRPEFNIAKNDIQYLRNHKADNSKVEEAAQKAQSAIEKADEANETSLNALRVTQEYGDAIQSAINKAQIASEQSANAINEAQTAKERADEVEEITRSFEQNIQNANDKSDEALKQVGDKVDKEWGKGLSSNDFTDDLKKKLEDLSDQSEQNVQADWQETDPNSDSYIKNKPNLGSLAGKSKVEKGDLDSGLQHSIDRANSSLQSESDPTVPQWAKQTQKPKYTASEVGAVPDTRKVNGKQLNKDITLSYSDVGALSSSTKLSDLPEDDTHQTVTKAQKESWITKAVSDLVNYYTKSNTYSKTDVNELVAKIPKFSIKVVDYLPASDISQTTIYLLKYGSTEGNLYTEYIYADGKWEILGTQSLNLDGYATEDWVTEQGYLKSDEQKKVNDAVAKKLTNLESILDDLTYVNIAIDSFSNSNSGQYEIGTQITASSVLDWSTSKTPKALSLKRGNTTLSTNTSLTTYTDDTDISSNTTWYLTVTGKKGETASKTTSISFYNKVYFGASSIPNIYNSDFILGLSNKQLASTHMSSITVTAAEGQYIYYCCPSSFRTPTFKFGANEVVFTKQSISFTNIKNYITNYDIYRAPNIVVGTTTIQIS